MLTFLYMAVIRRLMLDGRREDAFHIAQRLKQTVPLTHRTLQEIEQVVGPRSYHPDLGWYEDEVPAGAASATVFPMQAEYVIHCRVR